MTRPERTIILPASLSLHESGDAPQRKAGTPGAPGRRRDGASIMLLNEWIRYPRHIGSVCPSSRFLSRQMAAAIDVHAPGLVVELGGGTGTVTRSLLRQGVAAERLVVIEKSAKLAHYLARQFPRVCVVHGDAADAAAIVRHGTALNAVISSLPLRSLPTSAVRDIAANWFQVLGTHGRVVQFTYAPFRASAWIKAGLERTSNITVWANFPPARVEVFRRP